MSTSQTHPNETCQERAVRESAVTGPSANFNRASAGYTYDTLIAMIAGVGDSFSAHPGNASHLTVIERRGGWTRASLETAVLVLRSYGVKVRCNRRAGRLTVLGPKRGGSTGRYSA